MIKESKINIYKLSSLEQRACFDFFTQLSKEEILIMFFIAANSATETAFIKEVLLDEKYVDIVFSDLQLNSIL